MAGKRIISGITDKASGGAKRVSSDNGRRKKTPEGLARANIDDIYLFFSWITSVIVLTCGCRCWSITRTLRLIIRGRCSHRTAYTCGWFYTTKSSRCTCWCRTGIAIARTTTRRIWCRCCSRCRWTRFTECSRLTIWCCAIIRVDWLCNFYSRLTCLSKTT